MKQEKKEAKAKGKTTEAAVKNLLVKIGFKKPVFKIKKSKPGANPLFITMVSGQAIKVNVSATPCYFIASQV